MDPVLYSPAFTTFAPILGALFVGHSFADHVLQTDWQARHKALGGTLGRVACGMHVAILTAFQLFLILAVCGNLNLDLDPLKLVLGMAWNAWLHYVLDRRVSLRIFAERTGKAGFFHLGDPAVAPTGTGAYAMDQAMHHLVLFLAALVIC